MTKTLKYLTLFGILTSLVSGSFVFAQQPPQYKADPKSADGKILSKKGVNISKGSFTFQGKLYQHDSKTSNWKKHDTTKSNYGKHNETNTDKDLEGFRPPPSPPEPPPPGGGGGGGEPAGPTGPTGGTGGREEHNLIRSEFEEGIRTYVYFIDPETGKGEPLNVASRYDGASDNISFNVSLTGEKNREARVTITASAQSEDGDLLALGGTEAIVPVGEDVEINVSLQNLPPALRATITSIDTNIQFIEYLPEEEEITLTLFEEKKEKQTWTAGEIERKAEIADEVEETVNNIEISIKFMIANAEKKRSKCSYEAKIADPGSSAFTAADKCATDALILKENLKDLLGLVEKFGDWIVNTLLSCITDFVLENIPDDVFSIGWASDIGLIDLKKKLDEKGFDDILADFGKGLESAIKEPNALLSSIKANAAMAKFAARTLAMAAAMAAGF